LYGDELGEGAGIAAKNTHRVRQRRKRGTEFAETTAIKETQNKLKERKNEGGIWRQREENHDLLEDKIQSQIFGDKQAGEKGRREGSGGGEKSVVGVREKWRVGKQQGRVRDE